MMDSMILLTGGMGFIGSHIFQALTDKNKEVLIYDSVSEDRLPKVRGLRFPRMKKLNFIQGDLYNLKLLKEAIDENKVDKVIHAAAISFIPDTLKNPYRTFEVNLKGTLNVLEVARSLDLEHILYISTSSVYGETQYVPIDEEHPLNPKGIYGGSKLAAEIVVEAYAKSYGLKTTIVRPTNVYGPGDLYNRVIKVFIENALLDKPLSLQGGGLQSRDFTYVEDTVSGIVAALDNDLTVGEVFNISYGEDHSIKEVAEIISEIIPGTRVEVTSGRRMDVQRRRLDTSKAQRILGYKPKFDLKSGIKEYIKWTAEIYFPFSGLEVKNKPTL